MFLACKDCSRWVFRVVKGALQLLINGLTPIHIYI